MIADAWFRVPRVSFKTLNRREGIAASGPFSYNQSCEMSEDTHLFVPTVLLRGNQKCHTERRDYETERRASSVGSDGSCSSSSKLTQRKRLTLPVSNVQTLTFVSACALALWAA